MAHENIVRLWNDAVTGGFVRPKLRIINKTSSYTVTPADFGSVFMTRGATDEVWFTLPAASDVNKGNWVLFVDLADVNMWVEGSDEGLVVFNNLTADNIGFGTASEKIGGALLAISDGTSWLVVPLAEEAQTISVDTTSTASATATATSSITSSTTSSATTSKSKSSTPTTSTTKSTSATTSVSKSATDTVSGTGTKETQTDTSTATRTATDTSTATATATDTSTATATGTITNSPTSTSSSSSSASATGTP